MLKVLFFLSMLSYQYPQQITVCLVDSGKDKKDMTTFISSDEKEKFFKKYPCSYDGECEGDIECQKVE